MAQKLIVPPNITPVTVAEAKIHERIDLSDAANDAYIQNQLWAATQMAENYTRRAFITQRWIFETTRIRPVIELPRPPLQVVNPTGVNYTDRNGNVTNIPDTMWTTDNVWEPGRLIFDKQAVQSLIPCIFDGYSYGHDFYCDWYHWHGRLSVEYSAGYGTDIQNLWFPIFPLLLDGDSRDNVPWEIKEAILQIFGHLYENRESQCIPCGAKQLLSPYKVEYL